MVTVGIIKFSAQKYGQYGPGITTPDLEDVKDSVKQGVSKVAGIVNKMEDASISLVDIMVENGVFKK